MAALRPKTVGQCGDGLFVGIDFAGMWRGGKLIAKRNLFCGVLSHKETDEGVARWIYFFNSAALRWRWRSRDRKP